MKIKSHLIKSAFALSAVAVISPGIALAADTTWILADPEGGQFTDGANWDTGLEPTNADDAIIGNGGKAIIEDGDTISITNLRVDNGTVEQTGGLITASGEGGNPTAFFIGGVDAMTGTYNVSGSSILQGGQVRVGNGGGTGIMSLSGEASYIGDAGRVTRIADGAGSTGTLSISDQVQWITNDWAIIGSGGTGTLNLSGTTVGETTAGMTVNGNTYIGDLGGTGTLNVSGTATLNSGTMHVGTGGSTGNATISDSAIVTVGGDFYVGNGLGSTGDVALQGGQITSNNWVVIGRTGGTGTMTLEGTAQYIKTGGGQFSVGNGWSAASNGTLTIKDSAILDIQNGELWIGAEGDFNTVGEMNVEGGTVNAVSWVAVGRNHSSGTLNISGGVFNVLATGTFDNGAAGNFTMEGSAMVNAVVHQTGGTFNNLASDTIIGETDGSIALWRAEGGVSNHNVLRFGGNGGSLGTMDIEGEAIVNTNRIYVSSNVGSTGQLNLNGGTLTTNFVEKGAGSGGVSFNGGILKASETSDAVFIRDFQPGDLVIAAGGLKVDTNSRAIEIGNTLSGGPGDGGLSKLGAGTLTLSGIHTYEGATSVLAGTLVVSGTLTDSAWMGVADGAIVTVATSVSLNESILLTLDSGSTINLDFSDTATIGSLVLDGNIMEIGTYDLAALEALGDTYNVTFTGLDATSGLVVTTAIPEPSTVALALVGLGGLLFLRRRAARQAVS